MEGNEANKEDRQHQEHIGLNALFLRGVRSWPCLVLSLCAGVRLVKLFRDERVAYYHSHEVPPKDHLAHMIDQLVPLQSHLCLEVTAFKAARSVGPARQDYVGQRKSQERRPYEAREELSVQQASRAGAHKGPYGLSAAVDADQAKEEDADVHGEVEEHRRHAADEHALAVRCQVCIGDDLEGEGKGHDNVGHHDVLQIDDEVRFTGDSEEHPCCQAVQ